MKKGLKYLGYALLIIGLSGCMTLHKATRPKPQIGTRAGTPLLPPYSGPKANITVANFEVKAAKATSEIGQGLYQMLITALLNSNRFNIVERQGAAQPADLIITVAVTEFEPETSGGRDGVGGGGGVGSGIFGGLLGAALNKAYIALDINVTDISSAKVLAATMVQGQTSDISGMITAGFLGGLTLGEGLSAYANTPMEKAIRICIIETLRYLSQAIPANYYKY